MNEPLSKRNAEVARLRALVRNRQARRESGRFVVEGVKLVEEVLRSELVVLEVFVDAEWAPPEGLGEQIRRAGVDVCRLASGGIERIASTTTAQPVVAEVALPTIDWSAAAGMTTVLVAVDVNDPGNLGTLARSAIAADFDALIALGETTDPFGPKAIRASAGALFHLLVVVDADVAGGLERLRGVGLECIGTRMDNAEPCDRADLAGDVALVLGNEAHGLDSAAATHIDRWVGIPMSGRVESLNVAMAGTILTYEIARQRRATA